MSFLARLLGTTGSGGWIIYAVLALAIYAAGASSATWVVKKLDGVTIADLRTEVALANGREKDARALLANQQKATALDIAQANTKALENDRALRAEVVDLNAKLVSANKARQAASTKLLDSLKAIPHEQQITLSPPVRQYLARVREQQDAAAGTAASDPPH